MTVLPTLPKRYCPVCNRDSEPPFKPGPGGRPDAGCPHCSSLERHRFLAILLPCLEPLLGRREVLLDVAPSPQVTPLLARLGMQHEVRIDLGADNRLVDVMCSLTDIPLPDDSVDLVVCYHVLEHIPDDRRAMAELARVLRPGGLAVLQVPFRPGTLTDEDPGASESERLRRFGQADHVRFYGDDFDDRLVEAGLTVHKITPLELLGQAACMLFTLRPAETVWLASPSANARSPLHVERPPTSLTLALDDLIGDLARQYAALEEANARVAALERRQIALTEARERARARVAVLERRQAPLAELARRLPAPLRTRIRRIGAGR